METGELPCADPQGVLDNEIESLFLTAKTTFMAVIICLIQCGAFEEEVADIVDFPGRVNVAEAFKTGRLLVVPSRAESFPYIVLEAGAAAIPQIVTNVGGIPEIMGPHSQIMTKPGNVRSLSSQIENFLNDPAPFQARASELRNHIRTQFSVEKMARKITEFYLNGLAR